MFKDMNQTPKDNQLERLLQEYVFLSGSQAFIEQQLNLHTG